MGEMADMFLDEVLEEEDRRLDYIHGRMSDLEAYEEGIIDEMGYMPWPRRPSRESDLTDTKR